MFRPIQIMIAGAQKAATSSLKQYLSQHPFVCCHRRKEFNFFNRDEENKLGYENIFPRYFGHCINDDRVIIAKNAGLMYLPEALGRLIDHNANVHLVVVLRNPVDRAYSSYWYARSKGWEDIQNFEEAIVAKSDRFRELVKKRNCSYLDYSNYYRHLKTLFAFFKEQQVHIFLLEDLKENIVKVCQHIYASINLDSDFVPETDIQYNKASIPHSESLAKFLSRENSIKNILKLILPEKIIYKAREIRYLNKKEFSPPPMNPETRARLIEYFKPYNKEVSKLIKRDLSHWNY